MKIYLHSEVNRLPGNGTRLSPQAAEIKTVGRRLISLAKSNVGQIVGFAQYPHKSPCICKSTALYNGGFDSVRSVRLLERDYRGTRYGQVEFRRCLQRYEGLRGNLATNLFKLQASSNLWTDT